MACYAREPRSSPPQRHPLELAASCGGRGGTDARRLAAAPLCAAQLPPQILAQLFFSMAIAEGLRAQIIFKGDRPAGAP